MTVYVSTLIDWLGEAGIAATLTGARDVPVEQLAFDSRAVAVHTANGFFGRSNPAPHIPLG